MDWKETDRWLTELAAISKRPKSRDPDAPPPRFRWEIMCANMRLFEGLIDWLADESRVYIEDA